MHDAPDTCDVTLVGVEPAGGFVSVIVTDCVAVETKSGPRPTEDVAVELAAFGSTSMHFGVTFPFDAGFVIGGEDGATPGPPPLQAPSARASDRAVHDSESERIGELRQ